MTDAFCDFCLPRKVPAHWVAVWSHGVPHYSNILPKQKLWEDKSQGETGAFYCDEHYRQFSTQFRPVV